MKTAGLWFLCLISVLLIQVFTGGYTADCGNHPDEAAHFVSSLAIADYVRDGFPDPVAFMKSYYAHFPKIAIGHWPPVFESLLAVCFLIFGGTFKTAMVLQAVIAATCIFIPAVAIARPFGIWLGMFTAAMVLFSPLFLPMLDMNMADTLVTVLLVGSAMIWDRYYKTKRWDFAILFAVCAAMAILTKGTALCLVLLPPIYLAAKRDPLFLFNKKTIICALLVGAVCIPWYLFTYQMAADGFVYHWGWDYTHKAAPFFASALIKFSSWPITLAFLIGLAIWIVDEIKQHPIADFDPTPFAVLALSILLFACMAPADLEKRYLLPCLPSMACLAVWLIIRITNKRHVIYRAAALTVLTLSAASVFNWQDSMSFHSDKSISAIMASGDPNSLVLISGSVPAEGSMVASFAITDRPPHQFYVIRAQKALAKTDWMNLNYNLRFSSGKEIAQWLIDNQIGWVILDHDDRTPNFQHNAMLQSAMEQDMPTAKAVLTTEHPHGFSVLYKLSAAAQNAQISTKLATVLVPGHLKDDTQ